REELPHGNGAAAARAHSSMLDIDFAQISDPGRSRDHNEDYIGCVVADSDARVRSHGWLFALADGVGGHDCGEVASREAVDTLLTGFRKAPGGEHHSGLLTRLVQAANIRVYESGRKASPGGISMATTIVACALRFDRAVIAHVGDSRCYLIRHGHAKQLTKDHTVVNDQLRLGILTAREAAEHQNKHLLSRSIGADLFVNVDTTDTQVLPGDSLLLCSDGFHGAVPEAQIGNIVNNLADPKMAAAKLVQLANELDGSDNISVQLVRIRNVERMGMYRGRPYKLR
ncbi:MAG TPA: protein phosphatase 2C domain-containing protein, partial [Bryobacteraceae bacterium]